MLGDLIGEGKGRRIVRRILSTEPLTAEVTFESTGTILGVATKETGTYTAVVRPDGSIFGHGQGLIITADGDGITWTGTGLGKFGPGGSVSYRGMIFYRTDSQKMARLNNVCGAFEFETDPDGNTNSKVWEWK
jgi:hypothetical protein